MLLDARRILFTTGDFEGVVAGSWENCGFDLLNQCPRVLRVAKLACTCVFLWYSKLWLSHQQ